MKITFVSIFLFGIALAGFASTPDSIVKQQNGVNSEKERYYYTNNMLDSLVSYQWDGEAWTPSFRERYAYSKGKKVEIITDAWFDEWIGTSKTTIDSVNINGRFINIENEYIWDTNDWLQIVKIELSNGNELISSEWYNSKWNLALKQVVTFNATTYLEVVSEYNSSWEQIAKFSKSYNANNLLTEEMTYGWDGSTWIAANKTTYAYNASNQITTEIQSEFDSGANFWFENAKFEYTYNASNNLNTKTEYNAISSTDWELASVETNYYKGSTAAIKNTQSSQNNIQYFATDQSILVNSTETKPISISILSLSGNLIVRKNSFTNQKTEFNSLPKGVLVVKTEIASEIILTK